MHKIICHIIMQIFPLLHHFSISRIHAVTFQMPSISTKTLCHQRGFILDKQELNGVQKHNPLTHHMHISSKLFINAKHFNMHNTFPKSKNISRYIGNDNSNTCLCLFGRLHLHLYLLELLESLLMCLTSSYDSEDLFLYCS